MEPTPRVGIQPGEEVLAMLRDSRTESERIKNIDSRLEVLKTARSSESMDQDEEMVGAR